MPAAWSTSVTKASLLGIGPDVLFEFRGISFSSPNVFEWMCPVFDCATTAESMWISSRLSPQVLRVRVVHSSWRMSSVASSFP